MNFEMNAFFEWVASHRDEDAIGLAGLCFDSPLARWLSVQMGYVVGVDGMHYGRALIDVRCWRRLPQWAYVFSELCERLFGQVLTASEVVDVLIEVEAMVALKDLAVA